MRLDPERTAIRQSRRLGFEPRDVRHIVLTHLDFDHAGGLDDFPWTRVHVTARELRAAHARTGFVARRRYRPGQWHRVHRWARYDAGRGCCMPATRIAIATKCVVPSASARPGCASTSG